MAAYKTVLVTGGAGFIGSNFVRKVLADADAEDHVDHVVVLDKLTYAGHEENLAAVRDDPRLTFIQGDICDQVRFAEGLARTVEWYRTHGEWLARALAGQDDFLRDARALAERSSSGGKR